MIRFVVVTLLLITVSFPANLRYCIQVATDRNLEALKVSFQRVKDYPEARIENRENLYLLRVGAEDKKENLTVMLRNIRRYFPDAFIKKCEINESYVVYPQRSAIQKPPELTGQKDKEGLREISPQKQEPIKTGAETTEPTQGKETKELLIAIKNELSLLRKEVGELSKNPQKATEESPPYFEKFLYSVGIFTGGLFFFTWVLLILIYRKVGASNVENTNLLNDMFNLIKVLNLLNKGQIIKMENGKLFVYDRKSEKWREVD